MYLIHSNLDFSSAKSKDLSLRSPYVEHARTEYNYVKNMPSPRLLKSHLPYSLLPPDIHKKQCKVTKFHFNILKSEIAFFIRNIVFLGYCQFLD